MKATDKLVSVFIPYYNDRAFLRECIDSVLGQSYENIELILLNHASTDGSDEIACSYTDPRIRHISLPENLGAGGGMLVREFLETAQGEYVKLFCADDVMHPDCIRTLVRRMEESPQADLAFGNVEYMNEHSEPLGTNWFDSWREFDPRGDGFALLSKYKTGASQLHYIGNFGRREAFDKVFLNRTLILFFDTSLWVEMLFDGAKIVYSDKITAYYRTHGQQVCFSPRTASRKYFESAAFCNLFYDRIRDVATLKKIFPESPFLTLVSDDDTEFIEFIVAHFYLNHPNESYRLNAYLRLERIFADDALRERIETKFAYGIREFREDYSKELISPGKRLKNKKIGEATLTEIIRVFFSRLWKVLSGKTREKYGKIPRRKHKQKTL